jgi:hypothetical protein
MPPHDNIPVPGNSLPPGPLSLSAAEIFQEFLPQVIKAATDSAASSTAATSALGLMENQLVAMRASLDSNTAALQRMADAKERENEILAQSQDAKDKAKDDIDKANQRWHATIRTMFPGPVVAQLGVQALMLVGLAFGLYRVMPTEPQLDSSATMDPSTSEKSMAPEGAGHTP